jgi:hypothetical protein
LRPFFAAGGAFEEDFAVTPEDFAAPADDLPDAAAAGLPLEAAVFGDGDFAGAADFEAGFAAAFAATFATAFAGAFAGAAGFFDASTFAGTAGFGLDLP